MRSQSDATNGESIESYVDNNRMDDLNNNGEYIANELICTETGRPATTLTCAIALAAAVCAATEGAAPGCFRVDEFVRWTRSLPPSGWRRWV